MASWKCPRCKRRFGRTNQSHGCAPAQTLDDFFAERPPVFRRIHDAIVHHLKKLGPVHVEAVHVGVMIKRSRTFAELRAKRDRLVLGFLLSRQAAHARITKHLPLSANRVAHFVDLAHVSDVDRCVREWLTEAYATSPE